MSTYVHTIKYSFIIFLLMQGLLGQAFFYAYVRGSNVDLE